MRLPDVALNHLEDAHGKDSDDESIGCSKAVEPLRRGNCSSTYEVKVRIVKNTRQVRMAGPDGNELLKT